MTKKGLIAIFNNGIEFIMGSAILVLITNVYSVEEAGAWIVFITLVFVGTKLREGITQTSLMKYSVGVGDSQKYFIYWLSIVLSFGVEILLGVIAFVIGTYFMNGLLSTLLISYFWISIPQSQFRLFQYISLSKLDVNKMFSSNVVLLVILSGVLITVYVQDIPFNALPSYLGIAYLLGTVWQIIVHKAISWKLTKGEYSIPEGYISFALNGLVRELFGTISSRAYILLTAGFVGYTESALVGIASRYANLIYLPNSAFQGLLYPKACELVNKGYLKSMFGFYRRSVSWMQAAFIPYVILLLTIGSFGIIVLHGAEYKNAIPFFAVLILAGAFISPFGHAYGSVCQAAGRPELVTKVVLLSSVFNLVLSIVSIKIFGVWGAILAPIITDLLGLIVISIVLKKVFNMKLIESSFRMIERFFSLTKIFIRIVKKEVWI